MAKVLFAHPLFLAKSPDEQRAASPYFPLGILCLAAYVRERGHDVAVFDGTFEPDESSFDAALDYHAPDVVAISAVLPARDLIDMDRYLDEWNRGAGYTSVTVATSRGCPFGCDWCRDSVHGAGFRQRSPESVAAEVAAIKADYAPDRLRLVDDIEGLEADWFVAWERAGADVGFEPLHRTDRTDLPLLDVADSL